MVSPSTTLTVWASSWLAGTCGPDDVLDAVTAWAPLQLFGAGDPATASRTGLPYPVARDTGTMVLLKTIRDATGPGAELRLVLPVPGDVRGMPVGAPFSPAAITAGEAVLAGVPGSTGIGLVPRRDGPDVLTWTVFDIDIPPRAEQLGIGEAEYTMRTALRDAAVALAGLQRVGGEDFDPRAEIEAVLAEHARHRLPPTTSPRAARVLDSADNVAAILNVAQRHSIGDALTAGGADEFAGLFRPLYAAVRSARLAAVDASTRADAR